MGQTHPANRRDPGLGRPPGVGHAHRRDRVGRGRRAAAARALAAGQPDRRRPAQRRFRRRWTGWRLRRRQRHLARPVRRAQRRAPALQAGETRHGHARCHAVRAAVLPAGERAHELLRPRLVGKKARRYRERRLHVLRYDTTDLVPESDGELHCPAPHLRARRQPACVRPTGDGQRHRRRHRLEPRRRTAGRATGAQRPADHRGDRPALAQPRATRGSARRLPGQRRAGIAGAAEHAAARFRSRRTAHQGPHLAVRESTRLE